MNIVFFGTSDFALLPLERLLESPHKVLAVVTRPDIKKGRFLKLSENPVKIFSKNNNIKIFQFEELESGAFKALKGLEADLFVVVSYGKILKKDFLGIPKYCSINLHGSLLPKYRGAAPINWAIIKGEKLSGATVIKMSEKMDAGDTIMKAEVPIDDSDTSITLARKISEAGTKILLGVCDEIASGKAINFAPQDNNLATFAPKLKKSDGLINWARAPLDIHNLVRGVQPWPGAFTFYKGKAIKIFKTEPLENKGGSKTGEIVSLGNSGILVKCLKGAILIKELQLEGKKRMDSKDFFIGNKIKPGEMLG